MTAMVIAALSAMALPSAALSSKEKPVARFGDRITITPRSPTTTADQR